MRAIDGDALIDWIDPGHLRHPSELCFSELDVVNMINHAPTIEPERKKGHWIRHPEQRNIFNGKTIECSECHEKYTVQYVEDELFCRHCGADMRGENDNK